MRPEGFFIKGPAMTWLGSILICLLWLFPFRPVAAQELPSDILGPETQPSSTAPKNAEKEVFHQELKRLEADFRKEIPNQSGTLSLGFNQAVQLGILNNIRTMMAREQVYEAKGDYKRSLSGMLPNLNAKVGQMRRTSNFLAEGIDPNQIPGFPTGVFGPYNSFDARVYLVQNIFDLTAIGSMQAGASRLKRARIKVTMTQHLIFKKTGEAYVKVLKYQGDVEAAEADLELAKTLYDMTVVAFNAGVATGVDKARAESRMLASETKLLQSKTNLDQAQNALKEILMVPMETSLKLTSPLSAKTKTPPPADRAVATAQAKRPDILAAKEQIRMAGYEHRAAVGQQVPSLAFGANYGGTGNTPGENVAGTYQLAGLIQIPIFDGGNTVGEIQVTKSKKKQAQIILGTLVQQADKEVHDALDTMKYSSQSIVAAKKRVEVAKLELELTRDRFFAGVDDNLELTRAQSNLAEARDEYIQALAEYNDARIMLAYAMGVIGDFRF